MGCLLLQKNYKTNALKLIIFQLSTASKEGNISCYRNVELIMYGMLNEFIQADLLNSRQIIKNAITSLIFDFKYTLRC